MDDRSIMELVEDLERMRQLLDRCIRRLRQPDGIRPAESESVGLAPRNDIRAEIERQRREIMAQVEQAKGEALRAASIAAARAPGVPGAMPGLGAEASLGMLGVMGRRIAEGERK